MSGYFPLSSLDVIYTFCYFGIVSQHSIAGMATIYVLQDRDDENSGNNSQGLVGGTGRVDFGAGRNDSNSPSLATTQPVVSIISNLTNTVKPHPKKVISSISAHTVSPTDQRGSQRTDIRQLRPKTTLEADGNFQFRELLLKSVHCSNAPTAPI